MNYNVFTIPPFDKQLKRLAKKYPSIKSDYARLVENLEINPIQGVPLIHNCYKIRIAITSKQKGKRSGARIISNFAILENSVYLLSIYDKSDKDAISDKELVELLSVVNP